MRRILSCCVLFLAAMSVAAQVKPGEVLGTLSGVVNKYHGEFSDDMFGPGGSASIQYAPHKRIILEPRFSIGTTKWKINPSDFVALPGYFGSNAGYGKNYPGTNSAIQNANTISFYTVDALFNYVVVPDIPATVFLSAGVGFIDWKSATKQGQPLPNASLGRYVSYAVSLPVGAGARIPISDRVGLLLRLEHRFVFSKWLDDFHLRGGNDALSNVSIGLTYRFTDPPERIAEWAYDAAPESFDCDNGDWTLDCYEYPDCCNEAMECCGVCDHCCANHDHRCKACCYHCCGCCCCCCNPSPSIAPDTPPSGDGGGGAEPAPADPKPATTPEPPAPGKPGKKFSKDIRFKLDTDEFDFNYPQTQQNLDELLSYMQDAPPGHEVIIEGHASGEGPPQRNKVLSDIRAKKIRSWLIEKGVDPSKIRGTVGYGSSMPRVLEPTQEEAKHMTPQEIEEIRAQNRRIEIYVQKDGYEKGT